MKKRLVFCLFIFVILGFAMGYNFAKGDLTWLAIDGVLVIVNLFSLLLIVEQRKEAK